MGSPLGLYKHSSSVQVRIQEHLYSQGIDSYIAYTLGLRAMRGDRKAQELSGLTLYGMHCFWDLDRLVRNLIILKFLYMRASQCGLLTRLSYLALPLTHIPYNSRKAFAFSYLVLASYLTAKQFWLHLPNPCSYM